MRTCVHGMVVASAMLAGAMGVASPAHAVFTVVQGNDPQPGQSNVISNACSGTITGPALTVQGCLNDDHTVIVNFSSDENISYTGGQASIVPQDGAFSTLTIFLASGLTFQSLILNIDALNALPNPPNGAKVTFTGLPGSPPTSFTFDLDNNGNNFFTITGENFNSITFTTNYLMASYDAVADVKQVRLGPSAAPVPEPGVLGLIGVGLVGVGVLTKRRRLSQVQARPLCYSDGAAA